MAVKIAGKQGKYGIIRHNTASAAATAFKAIGSTANQWTNPVLVATNFRTLLLTALTPQIDPGVTIDNYNTTSQLGLNDELSNFYVDGASGLVKLNFSALADSNTMPALILAAMQGYSSYTDLGGTYELVATSGVKAGTIDFNQGGGYTFGVCEKIGASADDGTLLQNGIVDSLNLVIDFNAKGVGRLVNLSGTFVFKSVAYDQTLTGTFVSPTILPYGDTAAWTIATFTSDSVDLSSVCIRRIEVTINNNTTSNCSTTSGAPNQYDLKPEYLVNIIVDHNTLTEKIRGDFKAGATVDINFNNGLVSTASGYLAIDAPFCKMTSDPSVYNEDFYGYNLQLKAYQSSTTSPITISVVTSLDWAF